MSFTYSPNLTAFRIGQVVTSVVSDGNGATTPGNHAELRVTRDGFNWSQTFGTAVVAGDGSVTFTNVMLPVYPVGTAYVFVIFETELGGVDILDTSENGTNNVFTLWGRSPIQIGGAGGFGFGF